MPLDAACLAVAEALDPSCDVARSLGHLDTLAAELREPSVGELRRVLFDAHRFRGDTETYDDPTNSMLHRVIERSRGIPISLSIVTIEVGRRAGLALTGVGMPGHFLVGLADDTDTYLDVFSGGVLLDRAACGRVFEALHGPGAVLEPAHLAATPPTRILARVLANLRMSYLRRGMRREIATVLRLRQQLPGSGPGEQVELADALERAGAFDEAAALLDELGAVDTTAEGQPAREQLALRAQHLRARLN